MYRLEVKLFYLTYKKLPALETKSTKTREDGEDVSPR